MKLIPLSIPLLVLTGALSGQVTTATFYGIVTDSSGARIPNAIGDVAGLPVLIEAMRRHGYGEALISKIAQENWLRVLGESWGG